MMRSRARSSPQEIEGFSLKVREEIDALSNLRGPRVVCSSESLMAEGKSRAPKYVVWLIRGAQPATNADVRLFAGSRSPALLPSHGTV